MKMVQVEKSFLPFQPHFFNQVNKVGDIITNFDISYLGKGDINENTNKLAHSTQMNDHVVELSKSAKEEERHMIITKK